MTSGSSATSSVCLDSKSITLIIPKSRTPALVVRYLRLVSKHAPDVKGPIRTSGVKVNTVCSPVVSCVGDIAVVSLELARLSNLGFTETVELLLCAVTIANLLLRLLLFKHWTWISISSPCFMVGGAVKVKIISPSLLDTSCIEGRELV